jgi:outer membrane lipoprotein-sorting protein
VKMPFKWTSTWLDGRDTVELKDVRPNVSVEAARFAKPTPPVAAAVRR